MGMELNCSLNSISNYTPIYQMNYSDGCNNYYIKRDDLLPFSFGGNKVRKALLFFREIEQQGNDCIVTYGSSSSNHCRVIANMAASKKLPCYIISPVEDNKKTYNSKMIRFFGAIVTMCPVNQVGTAIDEKLEELKAKGKNPYFIQGGGHGNTGTRAYVEAYEEIAQYEKEKGIFFDYIFHASGTGTTQAGLICGMKLNGDTRNIIGISVARKSPRGSQVILDSVNEYLEQAGRESVTAEMVTFIDDYIAGGYGASNDEILETIRELLLVDGVPLDSIYTGKAFSGMKEYIRKKQIKGKNILFIHTGGTPLFFDAMNRINECEN